MSLFLKTFDDELIIIPISYITYETSGVIKGLIEDQVSIEEPIILNNVSCSKEILEILVEFWEKFIINKINDDYKNFFNDNFGKLNDKEKATKFISCVSFLECNLGMIEIIKYFSKEKIYPNINEDLFE